MEMEDNEEVPLGNAYNKISEANQNIGEEGNGESTELVAEIAEENPQARTQNIGNAQAHARNSCRGPSSHTLSQVRPLSQAPTLTSRTRVESQTLSRRVSPA